MKFSKKLIILTSCLILAVSLMWPAAAASADDGNLVPNPSMEEETDGEPVSWHTDVWGSTTADLTYPDEGRTGNRSVKVDVSQHQNGDAKWYFDSVAVTPGSTYSFADYYKSSVPTQVVVRYTHQDGKFSYAWLGEVEASQDWALLSVEFDVPETAGQVTVFHLVSSVGWLIIDDAELRESLPPLPGENIIANASVENPANPHRPHKWQSNTWGDNTAGFSYLAEGYTGSRSVRTEITEYGGGDAKWYFDPVEIDGTTPYTFTDYYKSNVTTQLIARFTDSGGSMSYEWLGTVPASEDWQKASFGFTTPVSAREVTVFHIVSEVGWLVQDEVSLSQKVSSNEVENPSMELEAADDSTRPDGWHKNKWGENEAQFEYLEEGYDGSRSVKVTVSDYENGDAKWYFSPISLQPGENYKLSAWYKTNTSPRIVAVHSKAGGFTNYRDLRAPYTGSNAAADWQHYEGTFTVPVGTISTTIYFLISSDGWLQTDDFGISPYEPEGFDRPLISLTFDDGFEDNVNTALPVMEQYNFKSTQCYASMYVEALPEGVPAVETFHDAGHEICSHTVTHPFLTQSAPAQVQHELEHSQQVLEDIIGEPVVNFASPFGDYNYLVNQQIKQYYRSHRTVDEGFNSKDNFDIERVMVKNMLIGTSLQEFQAWLDYAEATNTWLVLVYHRVTPAPDIGPFDTPEDEFVKQMAALNDSGITVKTYNAALDELLPQLD